MNRTPVNPVWSSREHRRTGEQEHRSQELLLSCLPVFLCSWPFDAGGFRDVRCTHVVTCKYLHVLPSRYIAMFCATF